MCNVVDPMHDQEQYKATRDIETDECGGEGRECSYIVSSGAPRDLSEFAESNHTAFIYFDIFFRPEKRQS